MYQVKHNQGKDNTRTTQWLHPVMKMDIPAEKAHTWPKVLLQPFHTKDQFSSIDSYKEFHPMLMKTTMILQQIASAEM
jgi:hypothetical protein